MKNNTLTDSFSEQTRCCRHADECGGCQMQHIPYEEQLARKQQALRELVAPYWSGPLPIDPSPRIWHYRNRLDFQFSPKWYEKPPPLDVPRETVLGFKRRGRWYWPLEVEECLIGPEGMPALLESVHAWYRKNDLPAFDSRRHTGFLRILLVREGLRTGQKMVVVITSPGPFDAQGFVAAVRDVYPADSIYRGISTSKADVTAADSLERLCGAETIDEVLELVNDDETKRQLRFRLSPFSFFQTNTFATERLYSRIQEWVAPLMTEKLFDLYGGAGGIALTCAPYIREIVSVENVLSASEDGRHNAAVNNISNVTFVTAAVEDYLRDAGSLEEAAVILDPPRGGMHPKALIRLLDKRPRNILYVSCKPTAFANELSQFLKHYRLESVRAVDLFPHTEHVELLAWLHRP